jgi:hypothetical protein
MNLKEKITFFGFITERSNKIFRNIWCLIFIILSSLGGTSDEKRAIFVPVLSVSVWKNFGHYKYILND